MRKEFNINNAKFKVKNGKIYVFIYKSMEFVNKYTNRKRKVNKEWVKFYWNSLISDYVFEDLTGEFEEDHYSCVLQSKMSNNTRLVYESCVKKSYERY